ncbi:Protein of unknown function [Bacillus cytotoxicus]|uniref:Uncharacterized protein n=1 Tax=Bacillus cytotoxicus TaxID=580165 RepID=A0AAX2CF75_9BACI|nr:Protein of unknown function [Bacillus cytotoxicus]
MVSSRGKSKGCFATFVERKTRYYQAIVIPDRTAESMEFASNKSLPCIQTLHFKQLLLIEEKNFRVING